MFSRSGLTDRVVRPSLRRSIRSSSGPRQFCARRDNLFRHIQLGALSSAINGFRLVGRERMSAEMIVRIGRVRDGTGDGGGSTLCSSSSAKAWRA